MVKEAADKPREITYKGATDLVTDTDQRSEKTVLGVRPCPAVLQLLHGSRLTRSWPQFIQEKYPDHGVLGEEVRTQLKQQHSWNDCAVHHDIKIQLTPALRAASWAMLRQTSSGSAIPLMVPPVHPVLQRLLLQRLRVVWHTGTTNFTHSCEMRSCLGAGVGSDLLRFWCGTQTRPSLSQ